MSGITTPHFFNEDGLDKTEADIAKFFTLKQISLTAEKDEKFPEGGGRKFPEGGGRKFPHHISNTTLTNTLTDYHDYQRTSIKFLEEKIEPVETKVLTENMKCNAVISKQDTRPTEIGKDGQIYYTNALVDFQYTPKLLKEIILLSSNKKVIVRYLISIYFSWIVEPKANNVSDILK